MGEVIRNIDFKKKNELKKNAIAAEVGDFTVERKEKDKETGEVVSIKEKIEARKVQEYLKENVVESGDSIKKVDEKLKKEHGLKNDQMFKRNRIIKIFEEAYKKVFKSETADDYKKIKDEEIKRAA